MDNPRVKLDFASHWCARHLEPFRARWPLGAGVAMAKLAELAMADERIIAAAPKDSEGKAMTKALDALLREHSPLCCFVGEENMNIVYREADVERDE
jgi:hypothetical protein